MGIGVCCTAYCWVITWGCCCPTPIWYGACNTLNMPYRVCLLTLSPAALAYGWEACCRGCCCRREVGCWVRYVTGWAVTLKRKTLRSGGNGKETEEERRGREGRDNFWVNPTELDITFYSTTRRLSIDARIDWDCCDGYEINASEISESRKACLLIATFCADGAGREG